MGLELNAYVLKQTEDGKRLYDPAPLSSFEGMNIIYPDWPCFRMTQRYRSLFRKLLPEIEFDENYEFFGYQTQNAITKMEANPEMYEDYGIQKWEFEEILKFLKICVNKGYYIGLS